MDIRDVTTAIQLIELISNRRHLVFDLTYQQENVTADEAVSDSEMLLLDTENANHLLGLLETVRQFQVFLSTLSNDTGNKSSWAVAKILSFSGEGDIFKGFFDDELRKDPKSFFTAAQSVSSSLQGERAFHVHTVNPAILVTQQTLEDIEKLLKHGVCPDFIAMTRWPHESELQDEAKAIEQDFLTRLNALLTQAGATTSYKRLEEKGIQPRVLPDGDNFKDVQHRNMKIMADALTS